jgi:hypothetical protein
MINFKIEEEGDSLNPIALLYRSLNIEKTAFFKDNEIKIVNKDKKSCIIPYYNVKKMSVSLKINKQDLNPFFYGSRYRRRVDFYTIVKIETIDENIFSIVAHCTLKTIYKLIDLHYKINDFNFDVTEENAIKGRFSVPLFLYCNTGTKFVISSNFFGIQEYIILLTIIFYLASVIQMITYSNGIFEFIFAYITLIPACISMFYILMNEYKKKKILNTPNNHNFIETEYESDISSFNKSIISIVKNSKVLYNEDCLKYLKSINYIGIILSISVFLLIIYTTIKLMNFIA